MRSVGLATLAFPVVAAAAAGLELSVQSPLDVGTAVGRWREVALGLGVDDEEIALWSSSASRSAPGRQARGGAVISVYDDALLVEIAGPGGKTLDMVQAAVEQLDVKWP